MKTNKEIIVEFFEVFSGNPKTEAMIDRYVSDKDPELKGHILLFEAAIPCYDFIIEDLIAEGNKVLVRGCIKGKHEGFLFGYEASGNPINIDIMCVYELSDGIITNHWSQADSVGLIEQISQPAYVLN
jgi:hypothetical protein